MADPEHYLDVLKAELKVEWPANRTINLVFHGHSVPAGYFKTPDVRTLEAYPHLVLKELKSLYPLAVINVIVTAIGGENSVQGEKRFAADVLTHRPDVVFIDYALNDRGLSLEESEAALASMIRQAQSKAVKVILLTPTPDLAENILDPQTPLAARAAPESRIWRPASASALSTATARSRPSPRRAPRSPISCPRATIRTRKATASWPREIVRFFR